MDSILPYLESLPEDLLEPIELKDGAMILDHYMLTMHYASRDIGTMIITPYTISEIRKRLKNYFNILGLSVLSVYCRNPYQNNANPYGVLI